VGDLEQDVLRKSQRLLKRDSEPATRGLPYRALFPCFSYYVWALPMVIAIGVSTGHT